MQNDERGREDEAIELVASAIQREIGLSLDGDGDQLRAIATDAVHALRPMLAAVPASPSGADADEAAVERVARALYDTTDSATLNGPGSFDRLTRISRSHWEDQARAALAAAPASLPQGGERVSWPEYVAARVGSFALAQPDVVARFLAEHYPEPAAVSKEEGR